MCVIVFVLSKSDCVVISSVIGDQPDQTARRRFRLAISEDIRHLVLTTDKGVIVCHGAGDLGLVSPPLKELTIFAGEMYAEHELFNEPSLFVPWVVINLTHKRIGKMFLVPPAMVFAVGRDWPLSILLVHLNHFGDAVEALPFVQTAKAFVVVKCPLFRIGNWSGFDYGINPPLHHVNV